MKIKAVMKWEGKNYDIEYYDADSFADLSLKQISQAYGICFCDDKLLIGQRIKNNTWGPIGGTREKDELPEQTLIREIQEESNMEVLSFSPIGYQIVTRYDDGKEIQLRYCCKVRPFGKFVVDSDIHSDGGIDAIKLINPSDCKSYFDWGKIGDRIMLRALEILPTLS